MKKIRQPRLHRHFQIFPHTCFYGKDGAPSAIDMVNRTIRQRQQTFFPACIRCKIIALDLAKADRLGISDPI
jgi:hypothetical protein